MKVCIMVNVNELFIYLICCTISIYLKVDFEIMKMKYDNNSISISIGLSGWKSVWLKVLNTTFTNISAISWRSVFLVEETGIP